MTQQYYIGVDVGGSKIAAGLVSGSKIIKLVKLPTQANKGKKKVVLNIVQAINQVYDSKTKGIGIGFAGQIDSKKGLVVSSPNFGQNFQNVKVAGEIKKKFKKPVKLENDANCFTLAESIYGSAKGTRYVIGLTIGTGIGGGIVIDKKIYRGKNGFGGELGHTTIVMNGRKCSCGQKGHLEAYASGRSLAKIYQQVSGQRISTYDLIDKVFAKQKLALKACEIASQGLAEGLANLINIFNPDIIVIGGGLAKVKALIDPSVKRARKLVVYPELAKTKIMATKLSNQVGILGAALVSQGKY